MPQEASRRQEMLHLLESALVRSCHRAWGVPKCPFCVRVARRRSLVTAVGTGIRVTRFEPLGDGESYLLGFAAAPRPAFTAAVSALRSLPPWQRAWIPEEGLWWISVDALTLLTRSIPELKPHIEYMAHRPPDIAEAMGAYVRPTLRR